MKKNAVLLCIVLAGCIIQGDKISFEEIAKGESTYQGTEPLLFAAVSHEDIDDFVQYAGYQHELATVDYNQYVVVSAFLGVDPGLCDIEIHELIREEGSIIILTKFFEPVEKPASTCFVSPFHIIKIPCSEIGIEGSVSFLLQDTKGFLHGKVVVEV